VECREIMTDIDEICSKCGFPVIDIVDYKRKDNCDIATAETYIGDMHVKIIISKPAGASKLVF